MKTIYAITMWSGGHPAKKWQTYEKPELLDQGTGIRFVCKYTRLTVELIGPVSIEEYESGKEEIEEVRDAPGADKAEIPLAPQPEDNGNDRLF